jgi:hypothetical protein
MRNDHLDETHGPRHDPRDAAIDDALKQALRAEDPGAAFTQRVLAKAREERVAQHAGRPLHAAAIGQSSADSSKVAEHRTEVSARHSAEVLAMPSAEVSSRPPRTRRLTATRKLIAAIAASLTLAAAGAQWMQHRRYVAEGERARAQVLAALRLTNEKLDLVHDKITGREHAR